MVTEVKLPRSTSNLRATLYVDDVDLAFRDDRFERGENIADPWRRVMVDPYYNGDRSTAMFSVHQWNCTVQGDREAARVDDYLRSHGLHLRSRAARQSSKRFSSFLLRMEEDIITVCRALENAPPQLWIELLPLRYELWFTRTQPVLANRTRLARWLASRPTELLELFSLQGVALELDPKWPRLIARGPSSELRWMPSRMQISLDEEDLIVLIRKESTDGEPLAFGDGTRGHQASLGGAKMLFGEEDVAHYELWSANGGWRSVPRSSFADGPPEGAAMLFVGRFGGAHRLDPSRLCVRIAKADAKRVGTLLEQHGFVLDKRFDHRSESVFHLCFDRGFHADIWEAVEVIRHLDLGQAQHELMIDMDAARDRK